MPHEPNTQIYSLPASWDACPIFNLCIIFCGLLTTPTSGLSELLPLNMVTHASSVYPLDNAGGSSSCSSRIISCVARFLHLGRFTLERPSLRYPVKSSTALLLLSAQDSTERVQVNMLNHRTIVNDYPLLEAYRHVAGASAAGYRHPATKQSKNLA